MVGGGVVGAVSVCCAVLPASADVCASEEDWNVRSREASVVAKSDTVVDDSTVVEMGPVEPTTIDVGATVVGSDGSVGESVEVSSAGTVVGGGAEVAGDVSVEEGTEIGGGVVGESGSSSSLTLTRNCSASVLEPGMELAGMVEDAGGCAVGGDNVVGGVSCVVGGGFELSDAVVPGGRVELSAAVGTSGGVEASDAVVAGAVDDSSEAVEVGGGDEPLNVVSTCGAAAVVTVLTSKDSVPVEASASL